jgi:hypothetical protein
MRNWQYPPLWRNAKNRENREEKKCDVMQSEKKKVKKKDETIKMLKRLSSQFFFLS